MNKIMKTVFGSHLYGLSNPNSDTDYKGIYLPTLSELLLHNYKPRINFDTNKDGKNSALDVDMEWIALPTFIQMAIKGESEALDMLHSDKAQNDLEYSYIWDNLVSKRNLFYTKGLKAYTGMLRGQFLKNGEKGKKLKVIKNLINMLVKHNGEDRLRDIWWILPTGKYIKKGFNNDESRHSDERFWSVLGSKYQESIKISYCIQQLQLKYDNYGHRAKKAEVTGGYDWKAISHALRVGYQLCDIYECGTFSYPLSQTDYILAVKAGELDYTTVVALEFDRLVTEVDELSEKSALPERVDKEFWDNWLLAQYNNEFTLGELW